MEVLNGVVSKCIIGKSSSSSSSVVASSKTQLSFTNKGHLDYYGEAAKGKKGWNGISTEKKIKLLKTLTKDLSTFSHLPFGFNFDHINQASPPHHHNHNNNNNNSIIISQAAEVLLAQLKQLRTEEKLLKKKEKEEKKKKCKNSKCGSSSSESDSSDSECDKVVDIKQLRNASIVQPNEPKKSSDIPALTTSSLPAIKGPTNEQMSVNLDQECSNMILEATLNKDSPIDILSSKTSNLKQSGMGKRIEVCMGGKCKKSGAPALLEELHKAIGEDRGGGVIGCKCMGKCKSAPNVKVSTAQTLAHDSLRYPTNPLYIGVGLEDVELIVATCFGEEVKGLGMSIASVAS